MIVASSARDVNPAHVLRVAHLAKHYDHEAAIADVTFSVIPGEVLGIVGPNGAGKTTLLETLAGLLAASSGTVFWRGRELPVPRRKEALFYLPDGVKPYQDRFAAEVVSFFASVYGRSDREVAARIDSVGLAPALGKRVHALSKGYTRRLLLALGLLTPQDMLLMDEPFDGFDLRQTRSIIEPRVLLRQFGDRHPFGRGRNAKTGAGRRTRQSHGPDSNWSSYQRIRGGKDRPHQPSCSYRSRSRYCDGDR